MKDQTEDHYELLGIARSHAYKQAQKAGEKSKQGNELPKRRKQPQAPAHANGSLLKSNWHGPYHDGNDR